jgi:hypothetical protein
MNKSGSEALHVLRDIWNANGRAPVEVEELAPVPTGKICKNTAMLGIKGMEDEGMADAMRAEWRKQLAAEGKLRPGAQTIGAELGEVIDRDSAT